MIDHEKLREARVREGLSLQYVAAVLGVSERTVRRWEAGLTPVKRYVARQLADLYHVALEDLLVQEAA